MQAIYDVIGSILIGGIILMMLLQFNATVMEGSAAQLFTSIVQSNITAVSDLVEHDLRKAGYRVDSAAARAIVHADSNRITFRADIDDNGTEDLITYAFDPAKRSGHQNPRARILYRTVNGSQTTSIDLGLTRFALAYFDGGNTRIAGNPIGNPAAIRSIRLTMDVESTSPYGGTYQGATWNRSLAPKNLR